MKTKLLAIVKQIQAAILHNPAEVILSVLFFLFGCIHAFYYQFSIEHTLRYFPAFFLTTYTLNHLTLNKKIRIVYFLSILSFLPFVGIEHRYNSPVYLVTLIVFQLIYLVGKQKKDNRLFIQETLSYLKSVFSAGLLAGIIWLVVASIYYSITYIFEIWETNADEVLSCITSFAFLLSFPLLFLMFNEKKTEGDGYNKLFEVLLNYVLSPALLIYAVILYLYFIKITIIWSLPKGGIAYIVVSFTTAVFLLKGCQIFLRKQYYDWFYKYASFIVTPALILYWAGACYRINQYGFTERRVYLIVLGIILTVTALLFLSRKWGRYHIIAIITIILLSLITYIPGISADDIESYSQTYRKNHHTTYPENNLYQYSSYCIKSNCPIHLEEYTLLYPVYSYQEKNAVWMEFSRQKDSVFLYSSGQDTLYKAETQTLLEKQLQKAHIAIGDTIPASAYQEILSVDLDSALLVLESITFSRDTINHPYKVDHITPAYYLKKRHKNLSKEVCLD